MGIPGSAAALFFGSAEEESAYKIERSIRFNPGDSSSLNRTFSSAGNRQKWTISFWFKLGKTTGYQYFFSANDLSTNPWCVMQMDNGASTIALYDYSSSGYGYLLSSSLLFRDPSAWQHFVVAFDTTQATASNRVKWYHNGELLVLDRSGYTSYPPQNYNTSINQACVHRFSDPNYGLSSYMADIHFIDGQQLAPTDFGGPDDNNVWQPKKFAGSYGTADVDGSSSPSVFYSEAPSYQDISKINSGSGPVGVNNANGGYIRLKFDSAQTGVTSIKFTGGGYAAGAVFEVFVNGSSIGSHSTNSGWTEDSITISSTDITTIEFRTTSSGYALGQLKFNDSLVPGTPSLGTPGAGANSFHLDFADNSTVSALGTDTSGNSNNWTVNNIQNVHSTTNIPAYTGYSGSNWANALANMFDGSLTSYTYPNAYTTGTVNFSPAITGSSIRIRMGASLNTTGFTVNGSGVSGVSGPGDRWIDVTSHTSGSLTQITCAYVPGQYSSYVYAIEADGNFVGPASTVIYHGDSFVDTPTNYGDDTGLGGEVRGNYATWNPLIPQTSGSGVALSNGNLDAAHDSSDAWASTGSTLAAMSGKYYAEFTVTGSSQVNLMIGVSEAFEAGSNYISTVAMGDGFCVQGDTTVRNRTFTKAANTTAQGNWSAGDVISIAIDLDAGKAWTAKNNSWDFSTVSGNAFDSGNPTATWTDLTKHYLFAVSNYGNNNVTSANFGQRSWAYAAPSGFKALCTQNLSDPLVEDPSKYFDTILWSGQGNINDRTLTTTTSADLVWTKSRSHAYHNALFDTVRGFTQNALNSDQTWSENNATGAYLKSVTDTSITLAATSDLSNAWYNGASHTYVGWLWSAGSNSNRTYTVKVVSSGGNKYRFDGNGDNAVTLDLEEGSTYEFDQSDSSNSGHPLRFSSTANGSHGGGSEYTTGVTVTGTPGSAGAKTTIVIAAGAPTLYYYCTQHSGMGGQINTNSTAGATVLAGSLNSSTYNQAQAWNSQVTGTSQSYDFGGGGARGNNYIFDGDIKHSSAALSGNNITWNGSIAFTSSFAIASDNDGVANAVNITHGPSNTVTNVRSQLPNTVNSQLAAGTIPLTTLTGITSPVTKIELLAGGAGANGLTQVVADGKMLVDSGITPANVPSIASTVRANPSAGFSIVSYNGLGSAPYSIAHGLNDVPKLYISKGINTATAWWVFHEDIGPTKALRLDSSGSTVTATSLWNDTNPTSTVCHFGQGSSSTGDPFLMYAFTEIEGYSKFGSYTGNGSSTAGPFIYCGFRPAWILLKCSSHASQGWTITDTKRLGYNFANSLLFPDTSDAENVTSYVDILSNGFKLRSASGYSNAPSYEYIFAAFAEHPFKTSRAR